MKYITSAISAVLILVTYSFLLHLSQQMSVINESENNFVVSFPKILDLAARFCIYGGVVFEIIFLYKYFKHDPSIRQGHFVIGVALAIIGLLLGVVYARWSIVVEGNILTCNRVIKASTKINFEELDKVNLTGDIIRLTSGNITITLVDKECDNFDKLYEKLSEYGKVD